MLQSLIRHSKLRRRLERVKYQIEALPIRSATTARNSFKSSYAISSHLYRDLPLFRWYTISKENTILEYRVQLWEQLKKDQKQLSGSAIVKILDNDVKEYQKGSTLGDIARELGVKSALGAIVVPYGNANSEKGEQCSTNEEILDFASPLTRDIEIKRWIYFEDDIGRSMFWHSSAHILGSSIEEMLMDKWKEEGLKFKDAPVDLESLKDRKVPLLDDGPALKNSTAGGFFYDYFIDKHIGESEFKVIEKKMKDIAKKSYRFEKLEVPKSVAEAMFNYNPFKLRLISKVEGDYVTLYRCGDFIDLCRGPHIPHTGMVKAVKVLKGSGAYLDGNSKSQYLQRLYGITFPEKEMLNEWVHLKEEAEKRDHRVIGKAQKLFMFSPYSPGSPFFLPHGTRIFNTLQQLVRKECAARGYKEVITPLIFDKELWKTSGHWDHYKENMFLIGEDNHKHETKDHEEQAGLKPMNCPGHCLTFKHEAYSYRDLPIRYSDFSSLHRNEPKGTLTGLTRVRRFHQDDGHIFCRMDQIEQELNSVLSMVEHIYRNILKFDYKIVISTRPDDFMGNILEWEAAEKALLSTVTRLGIPYQINAKDGAFYGPKIDCIITDALKREHQCATIQLDFQLPQRFNLIYTDAHGNLVHPVIIHRAILGSFERMLALLVEHFGGKWPLWLSPRQVAICPISDKHTAFAEFVESALKNKGYFVEMYIGDVGLAKKVRLAQQDQCNIILVLGDTETKDRTVSVRKRDGSQMGNMSVDALMEYLQQEIMRFE